jgi:voltage-gated potassium channel
VADRTDSPPGPAYEEVFYPADRIPFVEWRQFSGARPTVVLTGVVTLLAFVTGLSNLSQPPTPSGPIAASVPAAGTFVRFAGVLFAFVLGLVTAGLQRRKRLVWRVSLVVLSGLLALPLVTLQTTDVPLFLATVVTIALLVYNRDEFDRSIDLSPLQVASLSSVVGVGLYGTVGAYGLRGQFAELDSLSDAVYYVIVTVATVGYGDITPTTPEAKWFSLSVILFGTGAFTVAVGALIGPAIESRMASAFGYMTASDLTLLEDHVVVLGHGDVTASLLDELDGETDLVVVTPDAEVASGLTNEGVEVLTDDPTDEEVLRTVAVDAARGVVVSSDDDARNVLAVLAAKQVSPDVRVVATANEKKHVAKLESVGTDEVINPLSIGGRLLGRSVLGDEATSSHTDLLGGAGAATETGTGAEAETETSAGEGAETSAGEGAETSAGEGAETSTEKGAGTTDEDPT